MGDKQERLRADVAKLERHLAEAYESKERAVTRAQLTRYGHVYVISNVGSFGEQVYKIGIARRLDPMDRVRELADASVSFHFDAHTIVCLPDAPTLERALHEAFDDRRINLVNTRNEFFRVGLGEIEQVVNQHHGEIEFTMAAEAEEYRNRKTMTELKKLQTVQQAAEPRVLPAALAGLIGEQPEQTVRDEA